MRDFLRILFFIFFLRPFMALFIGLRVYGRANIPKQYPFILAANHSSHLDTAALLSLFPLGEIKRIRPVAAADYFERNWLISEIVHTLFNILSINRLCAKKRHENPLLPIEEAMRAGQSLIFFPEGTRSTSGKMGELHSGILHLAEKHPEVPVVPVYLSNMWRGLPKGEFIPLPFFCEIRIGEPLFLKGNRQEALDGLKTAMIKLRDA